MIERPERPPKRPTEITPSCDQEMLRMMSRIECKQETMMEICRGMDEAIKRMTVKLAAVSAMVSMAVAYVVRDLGWLTAFLGGL